MVRAKRIQVSSIIVVIIVLFSPHVARTNPIPTDRGNIITPYSPDGSPSVYFKNENITVVFNETVAFINAVYTFANNASNGENLTIVLPFRTTPNSLELLINGTAGVFEEIENVTIPQNLGFGKYSAIRFNLTFNPFDEITVEVNYQRGYMNHRDDGSVWTYNFAYIVGTTELWRHSVTCASFEFWIPDTIVDRFKNRDDESIVIRKDEGFTIAQFVFTDWMPESWFFFVEWEKYKPWFFYLSLGLSIVVYAIPVIAVIFIGVIWWRKSKQKVVR